MVAHFSAFVTNCSARKSVAITTGLTAIDLRAGTQNAVSKQWLSIVDRAPTAARACELYTGRGMKRMRRLADALNVPLYVASAGLGLLKSDENVPSYDLSVSAGTPSAIQRRTTGGFSAQNWWTTVQRTAYAQPVAELFSGLRAGLVLIAVSNAYVPLLIGDLAKLSGSELDRLRLFGAVDSRYPPHLRPHLMPYDSRLDALIPGSKVDFAQRAAEHFIVGVSNDDSFPSQIDKQRAWVEVSLSKVTVKARQKRAFADDTRIRDFARELAAQGLSYTNALDALRRQHGIACEQSRFRRLYLEAKA
jgi:hypothetical protein